MNRKTAALAAALAVSFTAALFVTPTAHAATWAEIGDSGLYVDAETIQGRGQSYVALTLWNMAGDQNYRFPMGIDCAADLYYMYMSNGDSMVETIEPLTPAAMLQTMFCDPALLDAAERMPE